MTSRLDQLNAWVSEIEESMMVDASEELQLRRIVIRLIEETTLPNPQLMVPAESKSPRPVSGCFPSILYFAILMIIIIIQIEFVSSLYIMN